MTAEVAIINANAVAVAADSAVTIGPGRKIYNSAIKVFALSKVAPVGVMVYGNAGLLDVPWETIIKMYRAKLRDTSFATLEEYSNGFLRFLRTHRQLFPKEVQKAWIETNVHGYFKLIRDQFSKAIQAEIKQNGKIDGERTLELFEEQVSDHYNKMKSQPYVDGMKESDEIAFIRDFRGVIRDISKEVFERISLKKKVVARLNQIASYLHTREIFSGRSSGVVIFGFGDKDIYPVVLTYEVEGLIGKKLKYRFKTDKSHRIKTGSECSIIPFAQEDMVALFMEGINPAVSKFLDQYLHHLFDRLPELLDDNNLVGSESTKKRIKDKVRKDGFKLLKGFLDALQSHKHREHIGPVLNMVQVLPKDELAAMAETLVNLTAFKRRMTDEIETVGGPIDVAVISKGDGLVWIKRKHYFPKELNQHFFANYFREMTYDTESNKS